MENNEQVSKYKRLKLVVSIIGIVLFLGICTTVIILIWPNFKTIINDPELLKAKIQSYGIYGILVFTALQILQVIVAFIPGEVIEISAGVLYGWFGGFLVAMVGIVIATAIIFFVLRKMGKPIANELFKGKQFKRFSKWDKHPRRDKVIFLIFLIPGLPKDIFVYAASFFNISLSRFLLITTIARIPSVITSTIAGNFILQGKYMIAAIIFLVTGAATVICYLLSEKIMNDIETKKQNKDKI